MSEGERRHFLIEGIWVVAGQLLSALGALLGLRVLTDVLPPQVFGEVALVGGIVLLANGMAAGPLMQGVLRYYPEAVATEGTAHLRKATNRYLTRLTILTSIVCLVGVTIAGQFTSINAWLGILVVVMLILDVVRQRELTLMNAARYQRVTALWIAADVWARPVLAIGMIMLTKPSAVATLVGYATASLILILLFRPWFVRHRDQPGHPVTGNDRSSSAGRAQQSHQYPSWKDERRVAQTLLLYSIPLMPLGVIGWISAQADRYVVGGMIGIQEAGLYAATCGIVSRPFLLAAGAVESWLRPVYYEAVVAQNHSREIRLLQAWRVAMASVGALGIALFSLWHSEIASLLLAPAYRTASWLMPWIAVGYGLLLIAQVYERVCYAHKDTRGVFITETVGGVVALVATICAVYRFGLPGAAYALPVYFGAQLIVAVILAGRAEGRRAEHRRSPNAEAHGAEVSEENCRAPSSVVRKIA